jgi:hypothetical protein
MTGKSTSKAPPRRSRGQPIGTPRVETATRANESSLMLPHAVATAIVSCLASGRNEDAKRRLDDAVPETHRRRALVLAQALAAILRKHPRIEQHLIESFGSAEAAQSYVAACEAMRRGLLGLEEMMEPRTV